MTTLTATREYRTLFLSDFHLGTKGCQVNKLLDFLVHHDAETIYLVGDIVDAWQLSHRWYWPAEHQAVLHLLSYKAERGARLVYLPGNHDEFVREYVGTRTDKIEYVEDAIHVAADGKRYLVLHGDAFDVVLQGNHRWLAAVGDQLYVTALAINRIINSVIRPFGFPYWSFSNWAKGSVKSAVNFIGHYEESLVKAARENSVDGVICGHIHHASNHDDFGLAYVNCGDWVESCTAAVEHADGRMEVINWANLSEPEAYETESESAVA